MPRPPLQALALAALAFFAVAFARAADPDPFAPHLGGEPPEIARELPKAAGDPGDITLRRLLFRSRDDSQIFAAIAAPKSPGPHPGILVLHGGGGTAEVEKAIAWARRGYVAIAPDLPGIAEPTKLTDTQGKFRALKYGEGRWTADPDASASVLFDAVLSAMKSLALLRADPAVDPARVGVVGISWGGYMTTMVCALAGDKVRAGFSVFGCGFYELTSSAERLAKMPPDEAQRWLKQLDPGRRAAGIKAPFFIAAATNDFFFYPLAVQMTLGAIPGEKNQLYAPNANHKAPVPGGMNPPKAEGKPFQPTPFQPHPTPGGTKGNWLAMEVPFFEYHLRGRGEPLPKITVVRGGNPRTARFRIASPRPIAAPKVYWASDEPDPKKRVWSALPAQARADGIYEAQLPEAAFHSYWFALVSDDRPVTVASDLTPVY